MMLFAIKKVPLIGLLVCSVFSMSAVTAQVVKKQNLPVKEIPTDPELKIGELPNGFKYYLRKTNAQGGKTEMYFLVKAGTLYEDKAQLGLAHLVEHMGFQGLKHWPGGLYNYFLDQGLERGRDINAWTGPTMTNYVLSLPADKPALIQKGLLVARDWADGMNLDPKEVNSERGAIRAEVIGPNSREFAAYNAGLLRSPNYRPDDNDRLSESYLQFKHSEIEKFYRKWYTADRQAIVIVGDIDVKQVERDIVNMFSDMKGRGEPIANDDKIVSKWAVQLDGRNTTTHIAKEQGNAVQIQLFSKITTRNSFRQKRTVADYRTELIDQLYEELTKYRFMVDLAGAPHITGGSEFLRSVFLKQAQLDALYLSLRIEGTKNLQEDLKRGLTVIERIKRFGFDTVELRRAKQALERKFKQSTTPGNQQLATKYIAHFGFGTPAPSASYEKELLAGLLKEISLSEINEIARNWIAQHKNVDVVISGSKESMGLIGDKGLEPYMQAVGRSEIAAPGPCEYCDPVPEGLTATERPEVANTRSIVKYKSADSMLYEEGGLRIILKQVPSDKKAASAVLFQIFRNGGYSLYHGIDRVIGMRVAELVKKSGVGGMDENTLKRYLWGQNVAVTPYINEFEEGLTGYSVGEDLERVFQLLRLYFTKPNKDVQAFRSWLDDEMVKMSGDSIKYLSPPNIPGQQPEALFTKRDFQSITVERTHEIFRDVFHDLNGFTLVITGDFDPAEAKSFISKYLTSLNTGSNNLFNGADDIRRVQAIKKDKDITISFSGLCKYDDITNVKINALAEYLQLRLHDRLRNKEGMVYGATVSAGLSRDARYRISMSFITSVDNKDDLLRVVFEEIELLKTSGPDSSLLERAIAQIKAKHNANSKTARYWMDRFTSAYRFQDEPSATVDMEQLINRIKAADIVSAAQQFLVH